MDFSKIPLFGAMKAKLDYLSERQSVLAQNVANADTPGYKAMDVSSPDFKTMADKMMNEAMTSNSAQKLPSNSGMGMPSGHLAMVATDAKHMSGGGESFGAYKVEKRDETDELNPNGNNVAIEDEMMKIAQNQMDYNKTLNLYHKMISLFNTAVGSTSSS